MIRVKITANTPQDGEDNFDFDVIEYSKIDEILAEFMDDMSKAVYTSLVITIVRVQS